MGVDHQREEGFSIFVFYMRSEIYSRDIVFPRKFQLECSENGKYGKFTIMPLQKGFGVTVGNILRRTLLSSIRGVAVDSLKIEDVKHEYSTIDGVKQNVSEIIFNIRHIVFKTDLDNLTLNLSVKGPKKVYASDFSLPSGVEIVNGDKFLFEIMADRTINLQIKLVAGIGDVLIHQAEQQNLEAILLDKHFSPVVNVATSITQTRVDKQTDYDKLVVEVETNGSISAEEAFKVSITILSNFLMAISECQCKMYEQQENVNAKIESETNENGFNYNLFRRIDDLELSVRSLNCLKNDGIECLGDLVIKNENDMLKTPNFGRKSLNELKQILSQMKLKFGMNIEWPPKDRATLEAEAKRYFDGE